MQLSNKPYSCSIWNFSVYIFSQNVLYKAPSRLLKLEFTLPETKFLQNVETAETNLANLQQKLARKESFKVLLKKHNVSQNIDSRTLYNKVMKL